MPSPVLLRLTLAAAAVVMLASCSAPAGDPAAPSDDPTTPAAGTECPTPQAGAFGGAAVALDSAELLGASDLPDAVCAYGSETGDSIWIIAEPYDTGFAARVAAWLEPLGWTTAELGTWNDAGHLENLGFTPPAGNDVVVAAAHVFDAYPESVSFNLGLDQEFLSHYGVEPGDELAIFAAWR